MTRRNSVLIFLSAVGACAAAVGGDAVRRPQFVIPETLYAAPGIECNVYYAEVLDSVRPDRYAIEVRSNAGCCENDRWTWIPTIADAGRRERLVFNAWTDDGLTCSCTATVQVAGNVSDKSRRVTCAILGDSLTNARYQDRLMIAMREAGWTNFVPVGSRSGFSSEKIGLKRPGEAPHDGYGGYSPESFLTRYALSADEIDSIQDAAEREQMKGFRVELPPDSELRKRRLKSPLVRIANGRKVVDVKAWFDRINGGAPPDVIVVELGINGTMGEHDDASIKVEKGDNAVHPSLDGGKQLGDAIAAWLMCLLGGLRTT